MPSWRRVFTSEEARIEGLAGASPPKTAAFRRQLAVDAIVEGPWEKHDWPFSPDAPTTPPDDEALESPC